MDERLEKLIAVGASAAVNCHSCLEFHLAACDRLGIGRDDVAAAAEVGLTVNKGAAAATRVKVAALLGASNETGGCAGGSRCC